MYYFSSYTNFGLYRRTSMSEGNHYVRKDEA
jgi:hypothetical protein